MYTKILQKFNSLSQKNTQLIVEHLWNKNSVKQIETRLWANLLTGIENEGMPKSFLCSIQDWAFVSLLFVIQTYSFPVNICLMTYLRYVLPQGWEFHSIPSLHPDIVGIGFKWLKFKVFTTGNSIINAKRKIGICINEIPLLKRLRTWKWDSFSFVNIVKFYIDNANDWINECKLRGECEN